ncbi:hypothetical protein LAZ67_7001344 [Cordylochernes scorpioides]|uniref:Uncharacterized protein n=1 Tax=Cordylochernes scorpioides TaxID=51811 RepID=A0ABY6KM81_9ARAC|nr:hypothetical protein LAZ67_7001344 [Cordylochernes scorpioides]
MDVYWSIASHASAGLQQSKMTSERCDDAGISYNYLRNCGIGGHQHFLTHSLLTEDLAMR